MKNWKYLILPIVLSFFGGIGILLAQGVPSGYPSAPRLRALGVNATPGATGTVTAATSVITPIVSNGASALTATSRNTNQELLKSASAIGDAAASTCTLTYNVTGCGRTGAGIYTFDLTAANFTVQPVCTASAYGANALGNQYLCFINNTGNTTTNVGVLCVLSNTATPTVVDVQHDITCIGR